MTEPAGPAHAEHPEHPEGGTAVVSVPMWEWVVTRDADGGSAGVCQSRNAAMLAMTRALLRGRRPRTGHVTQVIFTSPPHRQPYYVRGFPKHTAEYDGTSIRWR